MTLGFAEHPTAAFNNEERVRVRVRVKLTGSTDAASTGWTRVSEF